MRNRTLLDRRRELRSAKPSLSISRNYTRREFTPRPNDLTPISRDQLPGTLDRFMAGLTERYARRVFQRIRATSRDRAVGGQGERRLAALVFARSFGMSIHPEGTPCLFNWDGTALNAATEAYVILHEVAHFALAPPARLGLIDFGLGPGPDTIDRDAAESAVVVSPIEREQDEAAASLLGILWEASLGQPALASFIDQNWLEGLDRSASAHFTTVLAGLRDRGLFSSRPALAASIAPMGGSAPPHWFGWPLPPPHR